MTASFDIPQSAAAPHGRGLRSARGAVLLLMLLYVLAGGGIAAYATWRDHEATVERVERSTADLARLLEDHFLHALQATRVVLDDAADEVARDGLAALEARRWRMAQRVASSPHIASFYLVDADGLVVSAKGEPVRVADRDFFQAVKGGAEDYIGQVLKDWWQGSYAFPVARRLVGPDGGFLGLAVANVSVPFFKELYHGLNLGSAPGLGVYRLDGAILVREPLPESDVGRNMSKNPVYTTYLPKAPIGTYHGKSAYDGVVRIVSYRKVDQPPLLVWVAMSLNDALADWWGRLYRNALLAVLGLGLTLGLSVLALRGIRRERAAMAALGSINLQLAQANAELERFAEVAAHHLQEPLRMIGSYSQILERRYADRLDGEAREFLEFLLRGSLDMKTLLRDLQRYTALDTGPIGAQRASLADAARQAAGELAGPLAQAGGRIAFGELPTVRGDSRQLQLLFRLLFDNAITYRAPDRPPEILAAAKRKDGHWLVRVSDNGIGIDAPYRERIFRMFERLHSRDAYPGTGIGLAICRKIVERHGGTIWCESVLGEGTSLYFTMPTDP